MTPEEKAKELIEKFKTHSYYDAHDLTTRYSREQSNIDSAKECAEICVDEIIESNPVEWSKEENVKDEDGNTVTQYTCRSTRLYWQSVKQSILNS